ncbi:MAG: DNA alkylation repair protein [Chitinophagaceae bacterium]|nr:MAG: DNA alkylation repair protein [Chitinophagaceae bacterium]
MATPLKLIYNEAFFEELTTCLRHSLPSLDTGALVKDIRNSDWEKMELKQRMAHIAHTLYRYLDGDYRKKLAQLLRLVAALPKNSKVQYSSLAYMYIPEVLSQFGLGHVMISLKAMEKINLVTSCEFAIRPFLLAEEAVVMKQMLVWSKHPHENIRRFASEGCRPRLPWGAAISSFKNDPTPIFPILENLKADDSLYVRKSVANSLNDISKDHPAQVVEIVKKWQGISKETDWIIKHACRGLVKTGNKEILQLLGTGSNVKYKLAGVKLSAVQVRLGGELSFEFFIELSEKKESRLRLAYAIYYRKANGSLARKLFHIREDKFAPAKKVKFSRRHCFQDLSTRKHYEGAHFLAIIVNGNEGKKIEFNLLF